MRHGRNWAERNADIIAVIGALFLYTIGSAFGCIKAQNADPKTAIETSLNLVADMVTPTIDLVRKACDGREALQTQAVRDGKQTSTQAAEKIATSRSQCDEVFRQLERVRKLHTAAADAYDNGALEAAQRTISEARETYHELAGELKELLR